jgi:hypothetical protein
MRRDLFKLGQSQRVEMVNREQIRSFAILQRSGGGARMVPIQPASLFAILPAAEVQVQC